MTSTLILLRHGESEWNLANRFTGWVDVDLSDKGRQEAQRGGQQMKDEGFAIDICFTSVLKRAIRTLWIALDEMDQMWVPVVRAWQLNERHYGGLQGLNKAETAQEVRGGAGQDLAPQLRHSAAAARHERQDAPALRAPLRAARPGSAAVDEVASADARPGDAVLGQRHRSSHKAAARRC